MDSLESSDIPSRGGTGIGTRAPGSRALLSTLQCSCDSGFWPSVWHTVGSRMVAVAMSVPSAVGDEEAHGSIGSGGFIGHYYTSWKVKPFVEKRWLILF